MEIIEYACRPILLSNVLLHIFIMFKLITAVSLPVKLTWNSGSYVDE